MRLRRPHERRRRDRPVPTARSAGRSRSGTLDGRDWWPGAGRRRGELQAPARQGSCSPRAGAPRNASAVPRPPRDAGGRRPVPQPSLPPPVPTACLVFWSTARAGYIPRSRELPQAVHDATPIEVVRRELDQHAVAGTHADAVPLHLPGRVTEHLVTVVELDPEHAAPEALDDLALHLDLLFLDRDQATVSGSSGRLNRARRRACRCRTRRPTPHPAARGAGARLRPPGAARA